jgi:hypothetical protein
MAKWTTSSIRYASSRAFATFYLSSFPLGEVADSESMDTILKIGALGSENGEPQVKSVYISHSIVQDDIKIP